MEIIWEEVSNYENYGYINKIHVFTIIYDLRKPNTKMYKLICLLPEATTKIGCFKNITVIENEAMKIWEYWLNKMNLKEK